MAHHVTSFLVSKGVKINDHVTLILLGLLASPAIFVEFYNARCVQKKKKTKNIVALWRNFNQN